MQVPCASMLHRRLSRRQTVQSGMLSLFAHAALGILMVVAFFYVNAHLYRRDWPKHGVTLLEGSYYCIAVVSLATGWYFNVGYVRAYPDAASWVHFTKMLFVNPASGSIGQDVIVTNALLFPLWTIVDGPRRGLKHSWIYFVMSLFTSFGFAMGLYLAVQERQVRWVNAATRGRRTRLGTT